jgi:hypothetical protein
LIVMACHITMVTGIITDEKVRESVAICKTNIHVHQTLHLVFEP